jgi:hypothetical protein
MKPALEAVQTSITKPVGTACARLGIDAPRSDLRGDGACCTGLKRLGSASTGG